MGSPAGHKGPPEYTWKRFAWMMSNAFRLKCPPCGERPLFVPWHQVRSLQDWLMPLDGCPRCGYAFEREPGFLGASADLVSLDCHRYSDADL
jgi:hypothetical protein